MCTVSTGVCVSVLALETPLILLYDIYRSGCYTAVADGDVVKRLLHYLSCFEDGRALKMVQVVNPRPRAIEVYY